MVDFSDPIFLSRCALILIVIVYFATSMRSSGGTNIELHGYQADFLVSLGKNLRLRGPSAALQHLVDKIKADKNLITAVFGTFHCVHCGSVKPADWISKRKGDKKPYTFKLSAEALAFLGEKRLVCVEKRGEPKVRQVVEGPLRADTNKATRCCIDWAIKNNGALLDGQAKPDTVS